jgi:hypothetical protein
VAGIGQRRRRQLGVAGLVVHHQHAHAQASCRFGSRIVTTAPRSPFRA